MAREVTGEAEMTRLLVAFAVVLLLATPIVAADLSGRWTLTFDPDFSGNPSSVDCTFKQDGSKLTVDYNGAAITGEVDGQKVTLRFQTGRDNSLTATLTGELDQAGTTLTGMWHLSPENRDGKFAAKKQ
jgi:opacity protein-like surface antigen